MKSYEEYESENEKWLRKRPKCECCGEHISDPDYYDCDDYDVICYECLLDWLDDYKKHHKHNID